MEKKFIIPIRVVKKLSTADARLAKVAAKASRDAIRRTLRKGVSVVYLDHRGIVVRRYPSGRIVKIRMPQND